LIIAGGLFFFKGTGPTGPQDYSKYIETGLTLDQTKIARADNPKFTGQNKVATATSSKIQVTEFLDYLCPACAANGEYITKALLEKYGDNIIITRKIFPVHGQPSLDVGRLVLASQLFGSEVYQKVHTKVFETQNQWSILGKDDRNAYLRKLVLDLGVDYDKLYAESQNQKYADQIAQDKQDATDLGIKATPSFIIGTSTKITGGLPIEEFSKIIDSK
jgi:protein-disulfide isomerase